MPSTITPNAIETSTYVVNAAFTDEDGDAVVPNTVSWALYDRLGNVINSHSAETETPATAVDIVLSGDDLDYEAGIHRILQVWGTYDSTLGTDLPYADEVRFSLDDLTNR